jgi:site-specific recombinase XerD
VLAGLRSARTRRAYAADVAAWLTWLAGRGTEALAAGRVHVDLWAATQLDAGAAASSVRRRLSALSSFYRYCAAHDLIGRVPTQGVARPVVDPDYTATVGLNQDQARPGSAACARRLFAAEQSLLLVRLAADCGARRGELAVLRLSDLDGQVLTIERSLSAGVPGPTKSGRTRRVTLGSGTADRIRYHFQAYAAREEPEEDWLFSPSPRRSAYVTAGAQSRRLTRLWLASGVEHAALHRLRHGVANYQFGPGAAAQGPGSPRPPGSRHHPAALFACHPARRRRRGRPT